MLLAVLTLVVAAALAAFVYWRQARLAAVARPSGPPTVLVVGPSFAGKTALLLALAQAPEAPQAPKATVTSVVPNVRADVPAFPGVRFVDCPGNERLQMFVDQELRSNVRAVVFLIDASSSADSIKAAAVPLARLLAVTEPRGVPLLVGTNKHDLFNTLSVQSIRRLLESEIDVLRHTGGVLSSDLNEDDDGDVRLGLAGKPFAFEHLESEVDVRDGSVKTGKLAKWEEWLHAVLESAA